MELDERKKENFQWFSVSPLFRFPIEGGPYQRLEICCCECDITSWSRHLAVLSTRNKVRVIPQLISVYTTDVVFVWGISGSLKRGFKVCFEQHVTLCGTKRENKGLVKKVCTFRDVSAGLLGLCMCVHVFHCSFRCCQVTKCFQMFVFLVNVNPSAYQVLRSLSCSIFMANKRQ